MELSFSNKIKNEIYANKPFRVRYKKAQAYGLFAFAKNFSPQAIGVHTEHEDVAKLFAWFAKDFAGRTAEILWKERTSSRGKTTYAVELPNNEDRQAVLAQFPQTSEELVEHLPTQEDQGAFLGGAFLACGGMTDPEKSYRLEFVLRSEALCSMLTEILTTCVGEPKLSHRRGLPVVYYKECAQIEDLLAIMGASKCSLDMIEIEMIKDVRNQVNRVTNCETANIDKTINAAAQQAEDIRLVLKTLGEDALPEQLRVLAEIRLAGPELSLRELADLVPGGLSRSGVHHRLARLSRMAEEIRESMPPKGEENV